MQLTPSDVELSLILPARGSLRAVPPRSSEMSGKLGRQAVASTHTRAHTGRERGRERERVSSREQRSPERWLVVASFEIG